MPDLKWNTNDFEFPRVNFGGYSTSFPISPFYRYAGDDFLVTFLQRSKFLICQSRKFSLFCTRALHIFDSEIYEFGSFRFFRNLFKIWKIQIQDSKWLILFFLHHFVSHRKICIPPPPSRS